MSRKLNINTSEEGLNVRYANPVSSVIDILQPKFVFLVGGRALGKTTEILAKRLYHVSHQMHGSYVALVGDTYMNLLKNVVPQLIEGLERLGWVENVHYVVGKKPPKHFKKPYKNPQSWKHTITTHTGCHIKLVSMDRPSTGAGDSYQHIIGDELKFIPERKINKLTPAIRGEHLRFHKSVLYRGRSFTTDMPNPNHREHDWILDMKKTVNKKQLQLMWSAANIINDIKIELFHAKKEGNKRKIENIQKNLSRWKEKYRQLSKGSSFYYEASSYANVDVLTEEFFKDLLDTMDFREMKISVLSIKPKLEKGEMFYPNLSEKNFYKDSYDYRYYSRQDLTKTGVNNQNSLGLKYLLIDEPIEVGLDTGRMCSLTIGQPQGDIYRILKFMYSLGEEYLQGLATKFRDFFEHHQNKTVLAWCDRSANQNYSMGDDQASKFKKAIEYDENGQPTGWSCTIMTRGQGTIYHYQEFELALAMMTGSQGLPLLMLPDNDEGKELKASLELSRIKTSEDKDGNRTIHKIKTSESKPLHQLPMGSTNPSDSLKYLLWRPEHYNKISGDTEEFTLAPGVF